jgi:radical SAM protein with 4Fe4S-binding SPASM domain
VSRLYQADRRARESFLAGIEARQCLYDFPPQVVIETTAACNLKCAHCGHKDMARRQGRMSMPLFRRIVDEIAATAPDTEVWPTFYGEAFVLGYRLFYMIDYAKKRGLTNLVLNTNGTLLTEEAAEWVIDSGLDLIMFSLDGFSAPVFERIRVGARRDLVFANVERLLEMKTRRGLTRPRVEVQFSLMDENAHEVEPFRSYWLERGADVKIREKLTWTGAIAAGNLDPGVRRISCPWALRTCAIHWNGDVVACAVDYEGRFVAGNLADQTIEEIWTYGHRALERIHLARDFAHLPAPCRDCLDWQVAGGAEHFRSAPDG